MEREQHSGVTREDIGARIAVLEHKSDEGKEDRAAIKRSVDTLHTEFSTFQDSITEMKEELARYRGFWGGAMLVASAVWAFMTFAWEYVVKAIKGDG